MYEYRGVVRTPEGLRFDDLPEVNSRMAARCGSGTRQLPTGAGKSTREVMGPISKTLIPAVFALAL